MWDLILTMFGLRKPKKETPEDRVLKIHQLMVELGFRSAAFVMQINEDESKAYLYSKVSDRHFTFALKGLEATVYEVIKENGDERAKKIDNKSQASKNNNKSSSPGKTNDGKKKPAAGSTRNGKKR